MSTSDGIIAGIIFWFVLILIIGAIIGGLLTYTFVPLIK